MKRLEARLPGHDVAKIAAGYRDAHPEAEWSTIWLAIETDRIFRIPAIRTAEAQLPHQRDVFMYLYSWESPGFGGIFGACHAIEIAFVFGCTDLPGGDHFVGKGPAVDRLAELTMDAWLAFAKNGDPAHPGLGAWPRYDAQRRATMEFGPQCRLLDDPAAEQRALWDGVL
jgi:para-nitrobenzyl esterase